MTARLLSLMSTRLKVAVKIAQSQPKVLMLGANALVRDNVRILLGSMGYPYLVARTLKEALALLEQEKPDAAIFHAALRQAGLPADQAVHLGDSETEDGQGAAGAGMSVILVRQSNDADVNGLKQVLAKLD